MGVGPCQDRLKVFVCVWSWARGQGSIISFEIGEKPENLGRGDVEKEGMVTLGTMIGLNISTGSTIDLLVPVTP